MESNSKYNVQFVNPFPQALIKPLMIGQKVNKNANKYIKKEGSYQRIPLFSLAGGSLAADADGAEPPLWA